MKTSVAIILFSLSVVGLANGQQPRSRPGAFATVPVPGQAPAPVAVPPAPGAAQPPSAARPGAPGQAAQPAAEQLRIVADPATNSLIVYGTAQEFLNVKNILKELDAIPRQVLLEVLVAEVTLSDNQSLGVDYQILGRNAATIFGQKFGSAGAIRTLGDAFPSSSGFGNGVSGVFGGKDIKAIVNALQGDSRFKVLSSPSILATDNKPARIQVGTEEPIATGTISQAVGGVANSTSIQYRNTGRIVTIIPQVNSQGLVNLQILAEVSQLRKDLVTVGQDQFPAFDSRQAETTAVVQDGDTLAIGGIITDSKNRTRTGVPYLMDIPVIGRFFGTTSDQIDRTELIMLITPRVIRNRAESQFVTQDFKNRLSIVRSELESLAREQELRLRLKPQSVPPPMPDPNSIDPSPSSAPSNNAPGRGASLSNPYAQYAGGASTVPSIEGLGLRGTATLPTNAVPPQYEQVASASLPPAQPSQPAPVYSLSIGRASVAPLAVAASAPISKPNLPQPSKSWSVQVAAVAQQKAAEALAEQLKIRGYAAFVLVARSEDKIWHRVRVGHFTNQQAATDLRKSLIAEKQFQAAYIATN
jgi:cell division septation protein DedD